MTKRRTHWLLTLPIVLAGIEAAHALANSLAGAPATAVFANAASGRGLLEPIGLLLLAAVAAALTGRIRGVWSQPRHAAAPFALLPPLGFALLELAEALVSGHALFDRAFALGLAFQLPVALLGYLLVRGLLRLSDELRSLVLAAPRLCPADGARLVLRAGDRPFARAAERSPRGRAPPFGLVPTG